MKRVTVVIVILLMLGSSLFAQDSYIGGAVGLEYGKSSVKLEGLSEYSPEATGIGVNLSVTGATYFGNSSLWGVGYTFGLTKAILIKSEGVSQDVSDHPLAIGFSVKGQRRFAVNNRFNFHLGVGSSLAFTSKSESGVTATNNVYSIIVDGLAAYKMSDAMSVGVGISAGIPVYSNYVLKGGGGSVNLDVDVKGFSIMPYVGILYNY